MTPAKQRMTAWVVMWNRCLEVTEHSVMALCRNRSTSFSFLCSKQEVCPAYLAEVQPILQAMAVKSG
jgi:hypothetical protein